MAKHKGIIQPTGTLFGVNFYMRKGKPVARKAGGGFNAKSIKKSPTMVRVRETYIEFGNTSKVKKLFRTSLLPFFGNHKDETLHSRMMQLFIKIKDCDPTSRRGERQFGLGLQTEEGKKLFTSFEFTPHPLALLKDSYNTDIFTYTVNSLHQAELQFSNSATHLELRMGVLIFDPEQLTTKLFTSEPLLAAKDNLPADFSLTPTEVPTGDGIYISVLGHRYVQEVNGTFYPLRDKMVYGLRVLGVSN